MSDCRGKSVYVFRSQRILGRLQQLVQADFRFVSDCVFTDKSAVFGTSYMADQQAFRTWNNAFGKRGSEDRSAFRTGYKRKSQYDKRFPHCEYRRKGGSVRGEKACVTKKGESMKKTYIYPQNMKAGSRLWLWSIRDFLIICLGLILSVVLLTQLWTFLPFAVTAVFAFLSIRLEETTVMDYIVCAFRFFVTAQQIFLWK